MWGTQEEDGKIREETNQTEPFQSTGCSKRNCELLGVSLGPPKFSPFLTTQAENYAHFFLFSFHPSDTASLS